MALTTARFTPDKQGCQRFSAFGHPGQMMHQLFVMTGNETVKANFFSQRNIQCHLTILYSHQPGLPVFRDILIFIDVFHHLDFLFHNPDPDVVHTTDYGCNKGGIDQVLGKGCVLKAKGLLCKNINDE